MSFLACLSIGAGLWILAIVGTMTHTKRAPRPNIRREG